MGAYVTWLDALPGKPVFVAYPAGFDFLFVYWYLMRFGGRSPFSHSALDVKTYAAALLKCRFHDATKRNMPRRWFGETRHTHVALDDALEQGVLFMNMRKEHLHGAADVNPALPIARSMPSVPPQTTTPSEDEGP